jgi:hypothetical protein
VKGMPGTIACAILSFHFGQGPVRTSISHQVSPHELSRQSAESYAVYSVLLPRVQSLTQSKFLVAANTVPYERTKSDFPVEPEDILTREEFDRHLESSRGTQGAWAKIWNSQPCILVPEADLAAYYSAMVDYRRKNETSMPLEPRLDLAKPYELVQISALDRGKTLPSGENNGACALYELSAVGFSSDMTIAIAYVGFDCPLCGRWALHVLQKTNGKWQEVALGCGRLS